jgi:RNA polymerase sigma-70 factor (ECF subfamily)
MTRTNAPEAPSTTTPSFEACCLPHRQDMLRKALRLTGESAAAQDLVQDTLVRAMLRWDSFQVEPGEDPVDRAGAWLYTVMHRKFLESCRRGSRYVQILDELREAREQYVPGTASVGMSRAVLRALEKLDPDQLEVVIRTDLFEQSSKDAAVEMGVSAGAVRVRHLRGRRRLEYALRGPLPASR